MLPKRLRISQSSTDTLKLLKSRTGLTPNIICRIALILSLEAGAAGGKKIVNQLGSEFNGPTLFGDYTVLFEAFILNVHGYLNPKEISEVIASHIEDGLMHLKRSKNLLDLIACCGADELQLAVAEEL